MMTLRTSICLLVMLLTGTIVAQPSNDDPCNAIELSVATSCNAVSYTNAAATPTSGPADPGCGGYAGGDVWFQFTMPNNGYHVTLELTSTGAFDGGMAVYSYSGSCASLTLEACDDNSGGGNDPRLTVEDGCNFENINEVFYVRVWENGNDENGTFNLCAYAHTPAVPDDVTGCTNNPVAGNTCCDAILLSDLFDGYCGNTQGYTADNVPLSAFCANIENNSWIAFTASDPTVIFDVVASSCSLGEGIQVAVFETSDCSNFNLVSNCWNPKTEASGTITATGLTAGENYYLMVDGFLEDTCDYTINVTSGVDQTNVTVDDDVICAGQSTFLRANVVGVGPFSYSWAPAASLDDPTSASPEASPTVSTNYTLTVTGPSGSSVHSIAVTVYTSTPTNLNISGNNNICENAPGEVFTAIADDALSYNWTVTGGTIVGSSTGSSLTVDWGAGNGTVCVEAVNECGSSAPQCINVTSIPRPNISAQNPPLACAPNTVNLTSIVISNTGSGGGFVTYHADSMDAVAGTPFLPSTIISNSGTYWIRMTSGNNCYDVTSVDVTIENPQLSVIDPQPTCSPNTIDLASVSINETNGFSNGSFTFYEDSLDATIMANAMSNTIVSQTNTYWVRYETPNGCFDVERINIVIDITPDLSDPITLAPICPGEMVDLDTINLPDANGATLDFKFFYTSEAVALLGFPGLAMTNTVVGAGSYWVWTGSSGGCSDVAEIQITESTPPTAAISGGGTVCPGDSIDITFSLTGSAPFEVSLSDGTNTILLSNLSDGAIVRLPVNGTTSYSLQAVTDATSCPGSISGGPVNANNSAAPTANLSGGGSICQGEDAVLTFNLTGTGPFDLTYADDQGGSFPLTNVSNGHTVTLQPAVSTTYNLISVLDNASCSGTFSGSAAFIVAPALQLINLREDCNPAKTFFTVRFEISGGDPSSYVVNGLSGTLSGNVFVSDPMPSNTTYSYTVFDNSGCPPITGSGQRECDCDTDAGTMDPNLIEVCANEVATAIHNGDEFLESGDILQYVLHDRSDASLGTILATGTTPSFSLLGNMSTGVTYYVSAIAGPDNGFGIVDQSHKCFSVAIGTPIRFTALPMATISGDAVICQDDSTLLTINFTAGIGPFDLVVADDQGGQIVLDDINDGHQFFVAPFVNTVYTIMSVADNTSASCGGNGQGSASVFILPFMTISNLQEACSFDKNTYVLSFDVTGGSGGPYMVTGLTGNMLGNTFTSDPIPAGTAYNITVDDGGTCPAIQLSGQEDCLCATNAGSMQTDTLFLCTGEDIVAVHNADQILDDLANDRLQFVLHDGDDSSIGNIMAVGNTPQFAFTNALSVGVVYHVSAIAGPDNGVGNVNPAHKCYRFSNGTPLVYYERPQVAISGDASICPGDSTDVTFSLLAGSGAVDLVLAIGSETENLTGIRDGDTYRVAPSATTTYTIQSVTDQSAAMCDGTTVGSAVVTVIDLPVVGNITHICNAINTAYQVRFEITGGNPSQYVVTGGTGMLDNATNTFTSDFIDAGTAYSFTVADGSPCDPIVVSGNHTCNCTSNVGQMSTDTLKVCGGEAAIGTYDPALEVLDGNDVLGFVLHDSRDTLLGNIFQAVSNGTFVHEPSLTFGTVYYISAVVGNDDGSGFPVLDRMADPCLSVAPGQPIVFYPSPEVGISGTTTICEGESTNLSFQLSGWPTYTVLYTDGTDTFGLFGIDDGHTIEVAPNTNTTYSLVSVRGGSLWACDGTIDPANASAQVDVTDVPEVNNLMIRCNDAGTAYSVSFDIIGGNAASYRIEGDTSVQLSGTSFTSSWYLGGSTYRFELTDGSGCPAVVLSSTEYCDCTPDILPQIELLQAISCSGESDGSLIVEPLAGEAPFRFDWNNGEEGEQIDSLSGGWYVVTMTDANNCESVDSFFLEDPVPITAVFTSQPIQCSGEASGWVTFSQVSGGTGDYSFFLNGETSTSDSIFLDLAAGSYIGQIVDANGCSWTDSITLLEPEPLVVDLGESREILFGDSTIIEATANLPIDTFEWLSQVPMPCTDCLSMQVKPEYTTRYRLQVTDVNGCEAIGEVIVIVSRDIPVYIPTVFSPNGDGANDTFMIYGGDAVERIESLRLFDRWGELLYEREDLQPGEESEGWDGLFRQKRMASGVYLYQAVIRFSDGSTRAINGDVTLLR
ncbi:MAG: gliding motility-associated C-terminal domain-containing protein [Bacteroidota bacterium]